MRFGKLGFYGGRVAGHEGEGTPTARLDAR
jgi:hypothetical protein